MSTWPFKILVKYTTRGRVDRFFEGMESIYNLCSQPEHMRVLITCDLDDKIMCNDEVKNRIEGYKHAHVIYGTSTGKINAINRDMDILPDDFKDWDIIANFSDDQRFTIFGWDDLIRTDFNSVFPETLDGYMAYLDTDTQGALSTLLIAGRKFMDLFGFIYNPVYISLFADNEMEDIARMMGKFHYTGYTIYQHLLPAYGHLPEDEMWRIQQDIGWNTDSIIYYERKSRNFDIDLLSLK